MPAHTLDALLDERAIIELTTRYAWAIDHRRYDDLASVFADDGVADYGALGTFTGPSAIAEVCARSLGRFDITQHICANHLVTIDGDRAKCRCYFQAQHTLNTPGGDENLTLAGSYLDDMVRTGSGWRIARRSLRTSWRSGARPPVPASPDRTGFVIAGWIEVDPARRTELLDAAVEMMRATGEEEGNLAYAFSADWSHPGRVRVFEQWRGEGDLRGHFETPHMAEFQKVLAVSGVRDRDLVRFEVASTGPVFR